MADNGHFRFMPHEIHAAYVTMAVFIVLALWLMAAELFNAVQRPSELIYLLAGHIFSEMKAISVGRGDGGSYEGYHANGKGNSNDSKN